jgi:hypothetical protein
MQEDEITSLKEKAERLKSLMEVSFIINSSLGLDKVIGLVMEKAQEVILVISNAAIRVLFY